MLPAPSTDPAATPAPPTCTAQRCTASAYATGRCRCDIGRTARRRQTKLREAGLNEPQKIDATGTRRRVEGLLAMGWTGAHIAAAAGITGWRHGSQLAAYRTWVRPSTATAVRRAVAKLGGTPGPSESARSHARGLGYVPLWAWDDDIDDPAARPQGVLPRPRRRNTLTKLTPRDVARFERYRQAVGACARWSGSVDDQGRGKFALHGGGRSTTVRARRVAYWLQTGRDPAGEVQTSCGNTWCCAGPHMVDGAAVRKAAA